MTSNVWILVLILTSPVGGVTGRAPVTTVVVEFYGKDACKKAGVELFDQAKKNNSLVIAQGCFPKGEQK